MPHCFLKIKLSKNQTVKQGYPHAFGKAGIGIIRRF